MAKMLSDLLGETVEVGTLAANQHNVDYVAIVRSVFLTDNRFPMLMVELVESLGSYRELSAGDLVTTWIGDGRFVRPVWRCAKCSTWSPRSELVLVEARLAGPKAVTAQHAAGFGCNKAMP